MGVSENNRRIAKNTIYLYFRLLVVMAVQLYTTRITLNTLGIVDFGLYGVIGGLVVIFTTLNSAFSSATSRFITVALGEENFTLLCKVFSSAIVIHAVLSFVVLLCCETGGLWFLLHKMVVPAERFTAAQWVYQFSVLTCLFSMLQVPFNALIIAREQMNVYAIAGFFEAFGKLSIAFLIQLTRFDRFIFYAFCQMLLRIAVIVFYQFYCKFHYRETRFYFHSDYGLYKRMLSYSVFDMVGNMSCMAQGQGLNMILNIFCGPVVNAARSVSYQVEGAVSQFANNFMTAVNPQIIKYYVKKDLQNMLLLVKRSSIFSFLLLFVMILPLSLEIRYVLGLWLGNYPEYAPSFVVLVLINALLSAFRAPRIRVFHATGHIKLSNMVTGTVLCMAFPTGYILMRLGFRPESVFIGVLGTTVIADCTNLLILKKCITYSIRDFLLTVHFRCLVTAVFASIVPFFVHSRMTESFCRLFCVVAVSVISVLGFAFFFAMTGMDRERVIAFARRRLCGR